MSQQRSNEQESKGYALSIDAIEPAGGFVGFAPARYVTDGAPEFRLAFSVDAVEVVSLRARDLELHFPGPQALDEMLRKANAFDSVLRDLETASLIVKKDASDAPGRITSAIRPFLEGAVDRAHAALVGQKGVRSDVDGC